MNETKRGTLGKDALKRAFRELKAVKATVIPLFEYTLPELGC